MKRRCNDRLRDISVSSKSLHHLDYDAADRLVHESDSFTGSSRSLAFLGLYPLEVNTSGESATFAPNPDSAQPMVSFQGKSVRIPSWLLGSVVHTSRENGSVHEEFTREPYGELLTGSIDAMPFGFKGYYQLTNTNQYWAYARYYDASLKFFLSPDPLKGTATNPPSMNRFRVFSADPVGLVDVWGLYDIDLTCCPGVIVADKRETNSGFTSDRDPRSDNSGQPYSPNSKEQLRRAREQAQRARERLNKYIEDARKRDEAYRKYIEKAKHALANSQPLPSLPELPPLRITDPPPRITYPLPSGPTKPEKKDAFYGLGIEFEATYGFYIPMSGPQEQWQGFGGSHKGSAMHGTLFRASDTDIPGVNVGQISNYKALTWGGFVGGSVKGVAELEITPQSVNAGPIDKLTWDLMFPKGKVVSPKIKNGEPTIEIKVGIGPIAFKIVSVGDTTEINIGPGFGIALTIARSGATRTWVEEDKDSRLGLDPDLYINSGPMD